MTNQNARAVESAIRLLRGETVAMPWSSLSIRVDSTLDFLEMFPAALGMELPDYAIEVGEVRVVLGSARLYNPRIDLADRAEIERRIATGTLEQVTLVPLCDSEFQLHLMRDVASSDGP